MSRTSHPNYYNQNPTGVECIDVIRFYTCDIANAIKYIWRQGLKSEEGIDDNDKAIEDCQKAIIYINDFIKNILQNRSINDRQIQYGYKSDAHPCGVNLIKVAEPYVFNIKVAMIKLFNYGTEGNPRARAIHDLEMASKYIQKHIDSLK